MSEKKLPVPAMAKKMRMHHAWFFTAAVVLAFLSGAMIGSGFWLGTIYIPLCVLMLATGLSKVSHTEERG